MKEALAIIKELEQLKFHLQSQLPKKYGDDFFLAADKIRAYGEKIERLHSCIGNQELSDQDSAKFSEGEEYWITKT